MSLNVNWVRALRALAMAGLLIALACAVLGSIGLKGSHPSLPESAVAPKTPITVPR